MNVLDVKTVAVEESMKVDKNTGENTVVGIISVLNMQGNGSEANSSSKNKGVVNSKDNNKKALSLKNQQITSFSKKKSSKSK